MEELDQVSPKNPVWLVSDTCHSSVVNSIGFREIGLPDDFPGVEKAPATGKPTGGFVTDQSHFSASRRIFASLKKEDIKDLIEKVCHAAIGRGVTTLHAMDGSPDSDRVFMKVLGCIPEMPLKIIPYFQTMDVERVLGLGLPRIGGCLTLDGAWPEHTVALMEPYHDLPHSKGILFYRDEQVNGFVRKAHEADLQIAMHAIGDAAIEQLLRSYEDVMEMVPRADHRHRIEHFSLPLNDHIERAKNLGLTAAVQPMFSYEWGGNQGAYVQYLGEERAGRIENFRALLDHKMNICGGSDSPVTPVNPLLGIHAAVNNPFFDHRITVDEAIRLFTYNGAYAAFEEKDKGSIEVGKSADLVVLSENPRTVDSEKIRDIGVIMTLVDGQIVYEA
ncbi:MAG: amidohydrolase [Deltaproteobacteria bacterium]|nr:amidohydrolase [Deltaproteobacteria bacterium]